VSDLQTIPIDELLIVAAQYGVHVRLLVPGRVEIRPPAGATPIERAVAGRLRQRAEEIATVLTVPQRSRPRRESI